MDEERGEILLLLLLLSESSWEDVRLRKFLGARDAAGVIDALRCFLCACRASFLTVKRIFRQTGQTKLCDNNLSGEHLQYLSLFLVISGSFLGDEF
tara:strand:- start:134 stop:421 length:288 start_codon:yes stop_codon:yes gene_type:complete